MTSSSFRAAISISFLIALAAGCASGRSTRTAPVASPMVTSKDLEGTDQSILEVLQAKVPGLQLTRAADGSISVEIRGPASFYSGSEPLFVLDGVPIQPGPGGALAGISPHDIESIQVLKNPADIAMYGVRGANGVILIKTKRPGGRSPEGGR